MLFQFPGVFKWSTQPMYIQKIPTSLRTGLSNPNIGLQSEALKAPIKQLDIRVAHSQKIISSW